jgi:hypothetical protein
VAKFRDFGSFFACSTAMFCSQCGACASGRFCSQCGAALQSPAPAHESCDWEHDCRYEVVLQVPLVRALVDSYARSAPRRLSGEQFLSLCEKLIPTEVPLELLASIVQPLYASWGIGTGKQRAAMVPAPIGRVMLRLLCSLASCGQTIRRVQQAGDGCLFEAALPSDMWSFEGDLLVALRTCAGQPEQTAVQAATKIKGQLFDWGKSSRCLNRLVANLHLDPSPQRSVAS